MYGSCLPDIDAPARIVRVVFLLPCVTRITFCDISWRWHVWGSVTLTTDAQRLTLPLALVRLCCACYRVAGDVVAHGPYRRLPPSFYTAYGNRIASLRIRAAVTREHI